VEPDIWIVVPVLSVLIGLLIVAEALRYLNNRKEEQMEKQFIKLLAKYEPYIRQRIDEIIKNELDKYCRQSQEPFIKQLIRSLRS